MKSKIVPIISVIIGIIAFALTSHYIRLKQRVIDAELQRIYGGARKILVVAAAQDIPSNTIIRRKDIGSREVFEAQAHDRVVRAEDAEIIIGRKTQLPIQAKRPILWSDIEGGAPSDMSLAAIVTPGLRAISLAVGGAAAVSSMVRPNDRVDVLGTFSFPVKDGGGAMETVTLTVLQDVTILATGQELANQRTVRRSSNSSYRTVTLEVTPREAELLVFAQQVDGSLALSLRNPSDATFESDLPTIDFDHLQNKLQELNSYRQKNIRHKRTP